MVKREELLRILKEESCFEKVIDFVKKCKSDGDACISEVLESCSRAEQQHIWQRIYENFKPILTQVSPEGDQESELSSEEMKDVRSVVQSLVILLSAVVHNRHIEVTDQVFQIAFLLQEILPDLPASDHVMKNSIARMFEDWWKQDLPHREHLILTSYIFLLERIQEMHPKPLLVDLKRVYALREVVSLVDLDAEESYPFKIMLQKCFISPGYIKSEEGLKFLSYILGLNDDMMLSIHQVVKSNLLSVPKSWAERFGEIYYRTWQQVSGPTRELFEEKCLQNLMEHAILGQPAVAGVLLKLLGYIHHRKTQPGVDAMLYRLYRPFLWSYLSAPNCKVRENAVNVFFEVFPLHDTEGNMEQVNGHVHEQFDIIMSLLKDDVPKIQALVVTGMFSVLRKFWNLVPKQVLSDLSVTMVTSLQASSTPTSVRVNYVWGLKNLLNNPLTHLYLKKLLPSTRKSFHDMSDVVRIAMCDLLLKVKSVRAIKFWSIVPVDHLMARLVVELPPVQKRIVKLVFEDFIPVDSPGDVQVERFLALLQRNPEALRHFYRYAPQYMDLKSTVSYILTMLKAILYAMRKAPEDANDDEEEEENALRISNVTVMVGLCEAICILWHVIQPDLEKTENAPLKAELHKKFTYSLPEMYHAFSNPEILVVLDKISGLLPPQFIPIISGTWMSRLRKMTDGQNKDNFIALLETLCVHRKVSYILELATDWLRPTLTPKQDDSLSQSRGKESGKRKKVCFVEQQSPQPKLAVEMLQHVFKNYVARQNVLQQKQELRDLREFLEQVQPMLSAHLNNTDTDSDQHDLLVSVFTIYCKLCIMLQDKDISMLDPSYVCGNMTDWVQHEALPLLAVKEEEEEIQNQNEGRRKGGQKKPKPKTSSLAKRKELAYSVTECVLEMTNNLLLIGQASHDDCPAFILFYNKCIIADHELRLISPVVLGLTQVLDVRRYSQPDERQTLGHWCSIPACLSSLFFNITRILQQNADHATKILKGCKTGMVSMLKSLFAWSWREDFLAHETMTTIMSTMLAELVFTVQQHTFQEETTDPDQEATAALPELPPLSQWLLDILSSQTTLLQSFVEVLIDACRSGTMTDMFKIHGVLTVMLVLTAGKRKLGILKELCVIVSQQVEEQTTALSEEWKNMQRGLLTAVTSCLKPCQARLNIVH